jgi:hypothetical protein
MTVIAVVIAVVRAVAIAFLAIIVGFVRGRSGDQKRRWRTALWGAAIVGILGLTAWMTFDDAWNRRKADAASAERQKVSQDARDQAVRTGAQLERERSERRKAEAERRKAEAELKALSSKTVKDFGDDLALRLWRDLASTMITVVHERYRLTADGPRRTGDYVEMLEAPAGRQRLTTRQERSSNESYTRYLNALDEALHDVRDEAREMADACKQLNVRAASIPEAWWPARVACLEALVSGHKEFILDFGYEPTMAARMADTIEDSRETLCIVYQLMVSLEYYMRVTENFPDRFPALPQNLMPPWSLGESDALLPRPTSQSRPSTDN